MYAALYPSYSSMETYFTFVLLYRVTKKRFLPFLRKKNSLKDSLVHLVSFITHFVYW